MSPASAGPSLTQRETPHYRMPKLQANGGYLRLKKYDGPEIPREEYENLTYTTYSSDDATTFAPITSCTGELELKGFESYGKPDLDGIWTENAKKCPTIVKYVESIGARFGRVQLLKMKPNTMRECRWGLHLDNNNAANKPEENGWVVRSWLELTDDDSSALVVRRDQFSKASEVKIGAAQVPAGGGRLGVPLPRGLPPRPRHPLRADHQRGERAGDGAVDRVAAAVGQPADSVTRDSAS